MKRVSLEEVISRVEESLERRELGEIKVILKDLHPEDLGIIIDHLRGEDKATVFSVLETEVAADVVLKVGEDSLGYLLNTLDTKEISELAQEMEPEEATDIVSELPDRAREEVLELISDEESREVEELLKFPETSAGGIMSPDFVSLSAESTVSEAISELRQRAPETELSYYVYVVGHGGRLVGVLSLRDLVIAEPEATIESIMTSDPVWVNLTDDQEVVAQVGAKYDLFAVPVVDNEVRLRGVVTVDDIVDVIEEEATEDMMRMGGVDETESVFAPPRRAVLKRLPWLYVNLFTAFLAASVVGLFEETIHAFVALAIFMPIVAGMGGSAGTQTLTLVVRGMALGEVTLRDGRRLLFKEVLVGFLTGIAVGVFTALVALLWKRSPFLGLVIGLALVINLVFACVVGVTIPLVFRKLKLDPALASSVFLTTIIDVIGFFVFLGLATLFLNLLR